MTQYVTAIIDGRLVDATIEEYDLIRARAYDGSEDDRIIRQIQDRLTREREAPMTTRPYTDAQLLGWADSYAQTIGDPCERSHVEGMIFTWQNRGKWPSSAVQTLPMQQVARILRGEARHDGRGGLISV